MKKLLSLLLCATLLTGGLSGGFSVSASNTSSPTKQQLSVSAKSDVPDQINDKGKKALTDYYKQHNIDEVPTVAAIYPMNFPAAESIDYMLLYYYPNGTDYSGSATGKVCLIDDKQLIGQIAQTLHGTNVEFCSETPYLSGYDISDYRTEFSLEIHAGNTTQTWNTLVGVDNYLMRLEGKKIGDYTDIPFESQKISEVISILKKLSAKTTDHLFSVLDEEPCIYRVDKTAHVYTTTDDLSKEQRDNLYKEYQTWSYTPISLKDAGELTQPNQYLAFSSGKGRIVMNQAQNGIVLTLEGNSINSIQESIQSGRNSFLNSTEKALSTLPQHPSWLYKLVDSAPMQVVYYKPTGIKNPATVSDTSRTRFIKPLLHDIVVKSGSFQRVKKDYTLSDALTFSILSTSDYTISMTDTQLLIHNDSVSYGALYQLENGKQTKAAFEKALNPFDAKQYADAYTQMILQLIKDDDFYFKDRTEMTIDLQNFPENSSLRDNVCKQIQQNLAKKGYSFTVYAGDFDQLIERGVWDKDVGGYQNGVLVEIDDKWNSNTSVSYIIGATVVNLAAVYYPENQAVFQNGSWQITPSEVVSMA